jgi:hypothetical protein
MSLSEPLVGSSWTGLNGGGADEIGVAAMGSDCDGGGVEEDIYKVVEQLNLVGTTDAY